MDIDASKLALAKTGRNIIDRLHDSLAPHAHTIMVFGALFCTLAVKFFHSLRTGLVDEYFQWVLADVAVLSAIEIALAILCSYWPRKSVLRIATVTAAIICTWSVINAGWLIRTGTQILPAVLLPLLRNPISTLAMVGVNLIKMPKAAFILLAPSGAAIAFLVFVLAKPVTPDHNRKSLPASIIVSLVLIVVTVLARSGLATRPSTQIVSDELRYNCQLRAVTSVLHAPANWHNPQTRPSAVRKMPRCDRLDSLPSAQGHQPGYNIIIVVLEGIQYKYTSLADRSAQGGTPHLARLADQGAEFANARSTMTHTTKAMFALMTGRFPSAVQDLTEAVPAAVPYPGIATILKRELNYRTACFESGDGAFECWPGLAHNLGFDKFWAREDLADPTASVGYFASDEFAMIKPIVSWIQSDQNPFCLVVMCSVSHDPYQVPKWFAGPAKEPLDRYRQTIAYTDKFLAVFDAELTNLGIADNTILCVIGDHGEAFGEHGFFAHERIGFEEALRVPWVIRAPSLIAPRTRITEPVSSVDLVPTLLSVLGFDIANVGLDGVNALSPIPADRKVYFACWMQEGPAGFVQGSRKFIYNPTNKTVSLYDLTADPQELVSLVLSQQQTQQIANDILAWRQGTIFQPDQRQTGKVTLFDRWLCTWSGRISWAQYDGSK